MVFQSILFIAYKKYKSVALIVTLTSRSSHITPILKPLYIGYLFNTVLTLNCTCYIAHRAFSFGELKHYLNT